MSKAILGAAMLVADAALYAALVWGTGGMAIALAPIFNAIAIPLLAGGVAMEAGAIAQALTSNRGQNITTRTPAGLRQIIYGEQRVGGQIVYQSTTGNQHWQMNMIIVLATHEVDAIENLYLDGRQVYWVEGSDANVTRNGVNFGGNADSNDHIGPGGPTYNFGTLVFCAARFGDQAIGDVIPEVAGNDPTWSTASLGNPPFLGGCTYVYLKLVYHSVTLPQMPEIRFTIRGKNNIFDPRTGATGYSTNWALIMADVITDTAWGLGDPSVNQAQLIAAANVCDETIATSQGGEANYACHVHYDTSTSPGDALNMMLPAAEGRLSWVGGEWYIWPAYWQGSSFSFDYTALIDTPSWTPNRSFKDLFNRVNGTYVAANYPYNVAGNLYDSNGWWNGTTANNWPYAFQPTNYPQYAQDVLHGYAADQWLQEDSGVQGAWSSTTTYAIGQVITNAGGIFKSLQSGNLDNTPVGGAGDLWWVAYSNQLPKELAQRCVLSIVQAQRLAKIHLLRNRWQGTGSFPMSLAAWQMIPTSVFEFTWPVMGWANKVLEVSLVAFRCEEVQGHTGSEGEPVMALSCQLTVNETDPSVYEWSEGEELTPYDVPAAPVNQAYTPQPPTVMTLVSSAATAIVALDGVITPRVLVGWNAPLDSYVTQIQIQYKLHSSATWIDAGPVAVSLFESYVSGVVAGQVYDFRIRSLRFNGATSVWLETDSYTVSIVLSVSGGSLVTVAPPGTLTSQAYAAGTSQITVGNFTANYGAASAACTPSPSVLTGLTPSQLYYVYYIDPTFAGGSITPIATQNLADFQNKVGYFLIGSIVTANFALRYQPSTYSDLGASTTGNPTAAYDNNLATYAQVNGVKALGAGSADGNCVWEGFPSVTLAAAMTLYVVASAALASGTMVASVGATIGGTTTGFASFTGTTAYAVYSIALPVGTNLATLTVESGVHMTSGTTGTTGYVNIFEIYIQ